MTEVAYGHNVNAAITARVQRATAAAGDEDVAAWHRAVGRELYDLSASWQLEIGPAFTPRTPDQERLLEIADRVMALAVYCTQLARRLRDEQGTPTTKRT